MAEKQLTGLGRLFPTRVTGVQYEVRYGIRRVGEIRQHGRGMAPTRWDKCSLRSANAQCIPDGSYFLHTEDGKVHQVECVHGQWRFLVPAV